MIVDLCFRVGGDRISVDHGYSLYSGLSRILPAIHSVDWIAVHPVNGLPSGNGLLNLTPQSRLRLRLPTEHIAEVIPLAGKLLKIVTGPKEHILRVGVPEVYALQPSPVLRSRCVVIKISETEKTGRLPSREMYLAAVQNKLSELGIVGDVFIDDQLDSQSREVSRRVLRIKGRAVVGYMVEVRGLNKDDSIKLQEQGLGGRRKMGCGVFVPREEKRK